MHVAQRHTCKQNIYTYKINLKEEKKRLAGEKVKCLLEKHAWGHVKAGADSVSWEA